MSEIILPWHISSFSRSAAHSCCCWCKLRAKSSLTMECVMVHSLYNCSKGAPFFLRERERVLRGRGLKRRWCLAQKTSSIRRLQRGGRRFVLSLLSQRWLSVPCCKSSKTPPAWKEPRDFSFTRERQREPSNNGLGNLCWVKRASSPSPNARFSLFVFRCTLAQFG